MKPISCGNLDFDARQSDVDRLFRKYGRVDQVDMKLDYLDIPWSSWMDGFLCFNFVACAQDMMFVSVRKNRFFCHAPTIPQLL